MTSAEIYKLRHHRTPVVCTAVLLLGVLTPSIVMVWYTPTDQASYGEAFTSVFETLSLLMGIVFGGWLLGTEYRQGTVKRLLTSQPRRLRALASKGLVGAGAMSVVLAIVAGVGWSAARAVGSMNDATVPWTGRSLLAFIVSSLVAAAIAYSLSAVTRSDSFAMVATLATILVVGVPLSLVPKVGRFTMFSAITRVEEWVSGNASESISNLSAGAAVITLAVWLAAFLAGGAALFATRDV